MAPLSARTDLEAGSSVAVALFPFFRATFYRWLQVWPEVCADLDRAAQAMADATEKDWRVWRERRQS
jgi:hypothetical protein